MIDMPTRKELAGLLSALRSDPRLRGFIGSVRVALDTGLPAMAYHVHSRERLILRRPVGSEPGNLVAELVTPSGSEVVADDRGPPSHGRHPNRMANATVRISGEMRAQLLEHGDLGEVIREAITEYLQRRDGESQPPL